MADPTTVTVETNAVANSCVDVHCDCNTMWSMAQQFSYLRLGDEIAPHRSRLVSNYAVRARRISATYARFYLESEDGGNPSRKGRFYWMALGAFASKTVACTLEAWQVRTQAYLLSDKTKEGLGKGNFWLFCDISGWHWYYARFPDSFDTCIGSRNAANYVPAVKAQVAKLPWSAQALGKIKNLAVSPHIRTGFAKVRQFEQETNARRRPAIQLEHLLAIAEHEQGTILQPLIYEDPGFTKWLSVQRWPGVSWVSPDLELSFSSACSADDAALKSVAPEDTKLENFASRMKWITQAAEMFHALMQQKHDYMEREISAMAGWVALGDD